MHGGNVELLAPRYGFKADEIIDFSVNINPMGIPAEAQEVLEESCTKVTRYPDPDSIRLREVLARWHKVNPENIAVGNGASELIVWLARLFPSKSVLILAPTFSEYSKAVRSSGGNVEYEIADEKMEFRHGFKNHANGGFRNAEMVFMCNPNNPTGTLYQRTLLEDWIGDALIKSPGTHFVIDESFLPFVEEERYSLVPLSVRTSQVIILRSMTKIFSVPGLRLGYVIAGSGVIEKLDRSMPTWRINILAQRFGERIFSYSEFLIRSVQNLKTVREEFFKQLSQIREIKVFNSSVNFFLIKLLLKNMNSAELTDRLAQKGILVRACDDFVGLQKDRFIRIAVRQSEENKHLTSCLREILRYAR